MISNVLVIGDTHAPFIKKGYLEFCLDVQERYKCDKVVHIGDAGDWHFSSFHGVEPAAWGANSEYEKMIEQLRPWQKAFPKLKLTWGNHDLIPLRKSFAAGLSPRVMKTWKDLYDAPKGWEFGEKFIINRVMYTHGTNAAHLRMKDTRISVVQGHLHSLQYVQWSQSEIDRIFAVQVGCGIDMDAYAFNYSKPFPKKPVLGCGVILNNGKEPHVIPFYP